MNRATLVGHVGQDPEIKLIDGGKSVAAFSLATTERWKEEGQLRSRTEWHRIKVWRSDLITLAERYVRRGSRLMIEGKIQTQKWTGEDGVARSATDIVLGGPEARIELLDRKRDRDEGENFTTAEEH